MIKTVVIYALMAISAVFAIRIIFWTVSNLFKGLVGIFCLVILLYIGLGWRAYKMHEGYDKGFIRFISNPVLVVSDNFKSIKLWN